MLKGDWVMREWVNDVLNFDRGGGIVVCKSLWIGFLLLGLYGSCL